MAVGDIVLVKCFGGEPLIRIIYREDARQCLICTEEEFTCWKAGGIEPLVVLCPKAKLFKYDNILFQKIKEMAYNQGCNENELEELWKLATPYYEET